MTSACFHLVDLSYLSVVLRTVGTARTPIAIVVGAWTTGAGAV